MSFALPVLGRTGRRGVGRRRVLAWSRLSAIHLFEPIPKLSDSSSTHNNTSYYLLEVRAAHDANLASLSLLRFVLG